MSDLFSLELPPGKHVVPVWLPPSTASKIGVAGSNESEYEVNQKWPDGSIKQSDVFVHADITKLFRFTDAKPSGIEVVFKFKDGSIYISSLELPESIQASYQHIPRLVASPLDSTTMQPHKYLTVIIDATVFDEKSIIFDVQVEHVLNLPDSPGKLEYDVSIRYNSQLIWFQDGRIHPRYGRFIRSFAVGNVSYPGINGAYLEGLKTAGLVERFIRPKIVHVADTTEHINKRWQIFGIGDVGRSDAIEHGGRDDMGFRPSKLVAAEPDTSGLTRLATRATQQQSSFPYHIRHADHRQVRLDDPSTFNFWFDARERNKINNGMVAPVESGAQPDNKPILGEQFARDNGYPLNINSGHMPNYATTAYLRTGRECYLDELRYICDWHVLSTWPETRHGEFNAYICLLDQQAEARSVAWALRDLLDLYLFSPYSSDQQYVGQIITDTLASISKRHIAARNVISPYGFLWEKPVAARYVADVKENRKYIGTYRWFQLDILAYQLWRCHQAGFKGAENWRDAVLRFHIDWVNSGKIPPGYWSSYDIVLGRNTGERNYPLEFTAIWELNLEAKMNGSDWDITKHNLDWAGCGRAALIIAEKLGMTGATEALDKYEPLMYTADGSPRGFLSWWIER